jgi:hypothetical protein
MSAHGDQLETLENIARMNDLPVSTAVRSILVRALNPTDDPRQALHDLVLAIMRVRAGSRGGLTRQRRAAPRHRWRWPGAAAFRA